MRDVSVELARVLEGGQFETSLTLDVFYGAERRLQSLTVDSSWELRWVKSADVPGAGSVLVQVQMPDGSSLTPREFTARLAPFGQEAVPLLTIRAGHFSETVQAGRFRIAEVPSARDEQLRHSVRVITVGSYVKLGLLDHLDAVREAGFTRPEKPVHTTDAWQELARLTGMRIVRSMPTVAVPESITYELIEGGRLRAAQEIAAAIGGTLYVRADGALTVLRDGLGTPVRRFKIGDESTLLGLEYAMSSEGVKNEVVGIFEDDERKPIVVPPAQIQDGPLRVSGPFGRRTHYHRSEFVKTVTQATAELAKVLAQVSQMKAFRVPVTVALDPRVEVGDTVELEQATQTYRGVVAEVSWQADGSMTLQVDVYRVIDEANLLGV
ncbi:hypothetical protein L332_03645 [Agrococcus pavilionensis RW1]|uniref:DUF5047 domain-containing protein n=1 Tax=Agrococcus pavilionensis RW1 TaxID=1330458 RepID=U1MSA3_9MICO|nr:hypothetical protein [Agrococcus pavilionensis]ERG63545.1 hypothetical protein L332_03645 [Agrococcus pavilionensis RW1]